MGDNLGLHIDDRSRGSLVGLIPSPMGSVLTLGSYYQNWVELSDIQLVVLEHQRNGGGKDTTYLVSRENKRVTYGQLFHMCL